MFVPGSRILEIGPIVVRRLGRHKLALRAAAEVEICLADVLGLHRCLAEATDVAGESWFVLLIDKRQRYSYSFEAQRALLEIPQLEAMAVLLSTVAQLPALRSMMEISKPRGRYPIREFFEIRPALRWLQSRVLDRESSDDFPRMRA